MRFGMVNMDESKRGLALVAGEAFRWIARHLASHASDIAAFVQTKYSFEEWLNWEALAAFQDVPNWEARPGPSYSELGANESKGYGDLLATNLTANTRVLIEMKLLHDGTGDKWLTALDEDSSKLGQALSSDVAPLQILVAASRNNIASSAAWRRWLDKTRCWNRATDLSVSVPLPPEGQMIVRGWTCDLVGDLIS